MSRKARGCYTPQKKLKVLIDMDQVLCDFESGFLTKYREKFPDEPFVPLEERNTFYVVDQYTKLREDLQHKAREILHAEGFFEGLLPLEGACDAVKEMAQMEGVEVFICTSPLTVYQYCVVEKYKWVEKYLGPEWLNKLIITKDKTVINGDVLIDDRPKMPGVLQNPAWKQVLFTAPFNRHSDLNGRLRLDNWTDGRWRDIIEDFKKRI